jgi:hypothetical protein
MTQLSIHINNTKKAPQFDGTNYAYWKVKMTACLKSINREVWKVTGIRFEVANSEAPTPVEEKKLQCNDIAISALHEARDDKTFEQVKNIEVAHDAWAKLEKTFEGTEGTKTAKAYILQEKFSSFKMQEDESVPEMFHRLQVIVNELKALGEEVKDNQFSMKFSRSLTKRFDTLITVLVRTTLKYSTPQQVFQEVMTDDSYREDDEKEKLVKKNKKESEKKDDEKKKSVAFKATTSKGKSKIESSSDEDSNSCDSDDIDEKMTLFVNQFGKFMKKKGYRVRRRKNSSKKNENAMRCFRCHSKEVKELNHTLAKAYGGEDRLLMCLGSQRASLYKEGLGYDPKKDKAAFAPHKTRFVKNNGSYCKKCKQVGHIEQQCMNKKSNANVSSIKLDSFYILTEGTNGVHTKFIGAPWMGSKKKAT